MGNVPGLVDERLALAGSRPARSDNSGSLRCHMCGSAVTPPLACCRGEFVKATVPGEIQSWLFVCGCEPLQFLTPIQDEIDLDGLARFAALLVVQEALPIGTHIKII